MTAHHMSAHHMTSRCITWRDKNTSNHIASNVMSTTSSDMTWHAKSQLTKVDHPTSPHNQPHYCVSPRKQLDDIKPGHITTMEQQKARSQQRHSLGIALVSRLAHIYSSFFFWNFRPRLAREQSVSQSVRPSVSQSVSPYVCLHVCFSISFFSQSVCISACKYVQL